jgi:ribulose bisphosphate carboxylase small subunit
MHADLIGALEQLNRSYKAFEHRGQKMSKDQVRKVLKYGIKKGYKTTVELKDEEVDKVLGWNICYKSNQVCNFDCGGLCSLIQLGK